MSNTPINQHALLSDCGAAPLVTSEGSVDWLSLPRFDSAPVLGRLLDDGAGHFSIAPVGAAQTTSRHYRPSGLLLDIDLGIAGGHGGTDRRDGAGTPRPRP